MTKIEYSTFSGIGEWRSYNKGDEMTEFSFCSIKEGTLIIGGNIYTLSGGVATVNAKEIKDGIYQPKVNTGSSIITLEPIEVRKGTISPTPTDEATIRRLCSRLEAAERQIESLTEICYELQNRMGNSLNLF